MILLGAGMSTPFGIPTMERFVRKFEKEIESDEESQFLYDEVKFSITRTKELIGRDITFDLESLMAVLEDISGTREKVSISPPTFAFISSQIEKGKLEKWSVEEARKIFLKYAMKMLRKLRYSIFDACVEPIRKVNCKQFNKYYGPLFKLLGKAAGSRTIWSSVNQWVFTTNWDLCLKVWLECISEEFDDGFVVDRSKKMVLNPDGGWHGKRFNIVYLHGGIDSVKIERSRIGGPYEDIIKVPGPHTYLQHYFKGNPEEIERIFMIYPLEAVGYENSIKSPYLDMLYLLRQKLIQENHIFVIGFSFRDVTIASIFEDALRVKAERKEWFPLSEELEGRAKEAKNMPLKFVLIDSNPETVLENLRRQGFTNIQKACIPIKVKLPRIGSSEFEDEVGELLKMIGSKLVEMHFLSAHVLEMLLNEIKKDFQLDIQPMVTFG